MSTTSFSVDRDTIIKAALRAIGVLGLTQTPEVEMYSFASEALNLMLKYWQSKGATLWKTQEIVVPLVAGVSKYPIGPTAGYISSIQITSGGSGYGASPTASIAAPGSFSGYTGTTATVTLTATGGVITGVTVTNAGAGYQSVPAVTLSAGVGGVLTPVVVGKTIERPLRILDQGNYIRIISSNNDTPIAMISKTDYNIYGYKASTGIPNSIYYDPQMGNGQLYVYPTPADSTRELHLFAQMPIVDMLLAGDVPDFPQEWFLALKFGLARELLVEYGADQATEARIERRYMEVVPELLEFSVEEASAYFTYDNRGR